MTRLRTLDFWPLALSRSDRTHPSSPAPAVLAAARLLHLRSGTWLDQNQITAPRASFQLTYFFEVQDQSSDPQPTLTHPLGGSDWFFRLDVPDGFGSLSRWEQRVAMSHVFMTAIQSVATLTPVQSQDLGERLLRLPWTFHWRSRRRKIKPYGFGYLALLLDKESHIHGAYVREAGGYASIQLAASSPLSIQMIRAMTSGNIDPALLSDKISAGEPPWIPS